MTENQGYENKLNLGNTSIFYEEGIDVQLNEASKVIKINQNQAGAKIYFINGELQNYSIIYQGLDITKGKNNLKFKNCDIALDLINVTKIRIGMYRILLNLKITR